VNDGEVPKTGWNVGFKGVLSKYIPSWVFDAGLGWFHDTLNGSSGNTNVNIETNAGFADLGARYRLSPNWQLGPVVQVFFGPDVGFSETSNTGSQPSASLFAGGRLEYEVLNQSSIVRVGAQIITSVTVQNREVTWFQADLQIGFPVTHREAPPAPAAPPEPTLPEPQTILPVPPITTAPPPAPEPVDTGKIFPAKVTAPAEVEITLSDVYFHFDTSSATLHKPSIQRLKKLGYFLLKNNDAWKAIRVDGHTDRRGLPAYNTRLSKRRALAVAKQLIANGLPEEKMKVRGFGPTRPVDPARTHAAYARNRRVELILEGVTDPKRLAQEINHLSSD
jgi:outer membrane protein OmpA-like peptidoglycan-associated protein